MRPASRAPRGPRTSDKAHSALRMMRSTVIDKCRARARVDGVDTERVSVHAIQTTRGQGNVNIPPHIGQWRRIRDWVWACARAEDLLIVPDPWAPITR